MRIAVVGAGRIGGGLARRLAAAGHDPTVSFARDDAGLRALADEIGAAVATQAAPSVGAEVVVLSVPWGAIPEALE